MATDVPRETPDQRRARLRKCALLCLHTLRNAAYLRSTRETLGLDAENYWINVGNNFLDIAVLEWCKLFADRRAKHGWRRVVSDPDEFWARVLRRPQLTMAMFESEVIEPMRIYRDRFVAHLDEDPRMNIPNLTPVVYSTATLYNWLREVEDPQAQALHDAPQDPMGFYRDRLADGITVITAARPR